MRKAPSAVLLSVLVPLASRRAGGEPRRRPAPQAGDPGGPLAAAAPASSSPRSPGPALRAAAPRSRRRRAPTRRAASGAGTGPPGGARDRAPGCASFDLLGVTWRPAGDGRPTSRCWCAPTATAAGPAGRALDATPTPDAREARTARPGTEPLWVGDVRRLPGARRRPQGALPRGLRVDLIDPGSSAGRRPSRRAGRPMQIGRRSSRPAARSTAGRSGAPTRASAAARRSTPPRSRPASCTTPPAPTATPRPRCPKILRAIYAYHVKGNGWSDIGYNFLVDRFGRLWEGRYGGMDRAVVGAHTGGFNVDTFAVSAIGNYDKAAAPPVMVDSIARVMAWKLVAALPRPQRHHRR